MKITLYYENKNHTTVLEVPDEELTIMVENDYRQRLDATEDKSSVCRRSPQEIMDKEFNEPTYNKTAPRPGLINIPAKPAIKWKLLFLLVPDPNISICIAPLRSCRNSSRNWCGRFTGRESSKWKLPEPMVWTKRLSHVAWLGFTSS